MPTKVFYGLVFALTSLCFTLTSCSYFAGLTANAENDLEEVTNLSDEALVKSSLPDAPAVIDTVRTKSDIWLGDTSAKIGYNDPFPARFEMENAITLIGNREVDLFEIAERITSLTGLLVRIDDLLLEKISGNGQGKTSVQSANISYSGTLSGLLDQISSRFGIWWKYRKGVITFYEMETRVFVLYALPAESSLKADVSNEESGGSSSSNSSTATFTSEFQMQMWKQVEETIKSLIPANAKMSISATSGTITVTAPPNSLAKVGKYVREMNEKLSKQVAITVKVLQVTLNEEHSYGLNLTEAFNSLNSTAFKFSVAGPTFEVDPTAGNVTVGLLTPTGGATNKFAGTQAIMQALSTQGDTSVVTTATVTTMNNKVAPVQVAQNINYVSGMTSTLYEGSSNPTYSIDTSTLNTGFSMDILPRVLDHGRLLMLFNMTLNSLLEMQTFTSSDTSIQLPTTITRGFSQEVIMLSGQTLVMSGFEEANTSLDKSGVGSPDNMLLGGKRNSDQSRIVLVVLITPEVLVSPLSPETRVDER